MAGPGGQFVIANYNVTSLRAEDVYIEFWAKMPGAKEGCKFLKIFGDRSDGNANTTISTNYTGGDWGAIDQVSFGDGTTRRNDSQNSINLSGQDPQSIGRSYGKATVSTPQMSTFSSQDWGTAWHHFRVHVKFNSGTTPQNEVADGEYYLEIDGKVYVDATGLLQPKPGERTHHYDRVLRLGTEESAAIPALVLRHSDLDGRVPVRTPAGSSGERRG